MHGSQRLSKKMVWFLLVFYGNQREHEKRHKKGRELLRAHGMTLVEPNGAQPLSLCLSYWTNLFRSEHYSMFITHTGKEVTIADCKLNHNKKKLQSSIIFATQYHRCSHESCAEAWLKIVLWYFAKFAGWTDLAVSVFLSSLASCLRNTYTSSFKQEIKTTHSKWLITEGKLAQLCNKCLICNNGIVVITHIC